MVKKKVNEEQEKVLEQAMKWWDNLHPWKKDKLQLEVRSNLTPELAFIGLTGREITELYQKALKHDDMCKLALFAIDGCYLDDGYYCAIEPVSNCNSFSMGLTFIDYNNDTDTLILHVRRPGLLIGKAGSNYDKIKKYLDVKDIKIVEVIELYHKKVIE